MTTIDNDLLRRVCAILGEDAISETDMEERVKAIADSPMHARRLIDWTREAFGIVLIGHLGKEVQFPKTFKAKAADGSWIEFSFDVEPIFKVALREAMEVAHAGPRSIFNNIATRGAMLITVNQALNAGVNIEGGVLSAPAMLGIPAEVYQQ